MGKTRDLGKKIRDTKGEFHAKMGTVKERSNRQRKKRKIYPSECRIPKSKER